MEGCQCNWSLKNDKPKVACAKRAPAALQGRRRHKGVRGTAGQRKRSAPTMMVLPSGSLQVVSLPVLSAVDLSLVSNRARRGASSPQLRAQSRVQKKGPAFSEELHQELRKVTGVQRKMVEAMSSLVDQCCVRHKIASVQHGGRRVSRSERKQPGSSRK